MTRLLGVSRPSLRRQCWRVRRSKRSFSTSDDEDRMESAVVFSSHKKRPLLTPFHLRDTASILAPQWRHLSPCLGAALACSPFTGNLMRLGKNGTCSLSSDDDDNNHNNHSSIAAVVLNHSAQLANRLFFQLIRESPLHITKNKSMPAAYLTPSLMGTILGTSLLSTTNNNKREEKEIRRILKEEYGIRSNYIHGNQWTGVSVARWMDLIPSISMTSSKQQQQQQQQHSCLEQQSLISGLWLVALWEIGRSKGCLLDFLVACDRHVVASSSSSNESIFCQNNEWVQAILHDPVAKTEWANQTYYDNNDDDDDDSSSKPNDYYLSQDHAQASMEQLLFYNSQQKQDRRRLNPTSDLEYAHALEVVCASVALQQQPIHSKSTAPAGYYGFDGGDVKADCVEVTIREIMDLLLWDEQSGSFDVTRLPSTASQDLIALYQSPSADLLDSGKDWFDVLSDMPGCDYLATSPNGKPYELAPTTENLSKVLRRLLVGYSQSDDDDDDEQDWTSLQDLSEAWGGQTLYVKLETLRHRSAASNQLIEHEIGTLQLEGSQNAIEIRLRCDWTNSSGMAVVTHLRQQQQSCLPSTTGQIDTLRSLITEKTNDPVTQTLALALVKDSALKCGNAESPKETTTSLLVSLLSAPYGCDRRGLVVTHAGHVKSQEKFQETALRESESVLKNGLFKICMTSRHDTVLCTLLLSWILSESPTVVEAATSNATYCYDPEIEDMILSLPMSVLENETIHDALERSLFCRGKVISRLIKFKSGEASILGVLKGLTFRELVSVAALYFRR